MPGTEYQYVEAAHRLGTRLSVNLETPTVGHMRKLSEMKDLERDILAPMRMDSQADRDASPAAPSGRPPSWWSARRMSRTGTSSGGWTSYTREWNLKRIYYAAFRPVRHTPLEEHPATPLWR